VNVEHFHHGTFAPRRPKCALGTNGHTSPFIVSFLPRCGAHLPAAKLFLSPNAKPVKNEEHNLLWPAASNVDKYEAQLPELLEPPDDTFATLYQLGFRKLCSASAQVRHWSS
jgi:hypothetical protein